MEERNLELDDDGKIKLRKRQENNLLDGVADAAADDIVIDIPDFRNFGEGNEGGSLSDEELLRRSEERERERESRRERAAQIYEEAERLYAAGDTDAAGEKYLDSAALYGADWRPWFGVVRVQTRDFTDFSAIYDCQQAYDKALRRMKPADRAAIAARYVPQLEEQADDCAERQEKLTAEDVRLREQQRPEILREYRVASRLFFLFLVLFALFAVTGGVLSTLINIVYGMQILVLAIIFIAIALVLLVVLTVCLRRFVGARLAKTRNARAGTTQAGEQARVDAETEELIRSIIEDFTK